MTSPAAAASAHARARDLQAALLADAAQPLATRLRALDVLAQLLDRTLARWAEAHAPEGAATPAALDAAGHEVLDALAATGCAAVWELAGRPARGSLVAGRMFAAALIDAHHREGAPPGSWRNAVGLLASLLGGATAAGRVALGPRIGRVRVAGLVGALPDLGEDAFAALVARRVAAAWARPAALLPWEGAPDGDAPMSPPRRAALDAALEALVVGWTAAGLARCDATLPLEPARWAATTEAETGAAWGERVVLATAFARRPLLPLSARAWMANPAFVTTTLRLATRA